MSRKLLEFNISNPLPEDYDPILGRSVGEIRPITSELPIKDQSLASEKSSVFDDPELDFAYQNPIKEELPTLSEIDIAIILNDESGIGSQTSQEPVITDEAAPELDTEATHDVTLDAEETETLEIESAPEAEILNDDIELAPEITPFETMDGSANEAINQAEEENNLSDRWRMIDDEILEEQKEEIIATATDHQKDEAKTDEIVTAPDVDIIATEELPEEEIITSTDETEVTTSLANEEVVTAEPEISEAINEENSVPSPETIAIEETFINETISENSVPVVEKPTELLNEPILESPPKPKARRPKGKKRRKSKRTSDLALMGGIFFTGMAILLLGSTLAAPLGSPFSDIASYGILWSGFAIIGTAIWAFARNWQMVILSLLCLLGFVVDIMPTLGDAPIGGTGETNVIGWANVENSPKALQSFVTQGEKNGATLLIVAGANKLIAGNIPNWSVIQVPIANDGTSLAVIAKENWRAVTLPGEPTMARPLDNTITVIGVNPSIGAPKDNAIINRAANRMGDQETAVLTVGDFGLVPWDRTMKDFAKTSGAKRIRCGGVLGTTYNQGLLNIATDHAFGFNAKVQKCDIGDNLPQSHHKPLFIKVLKN